MSFLKEVIQLYVERKDWFLELIAAHIGLSLVAILCAGSIGLLLGIWISEHEKAAGPVLGSCQCILYHTFDFAFGNADSVFGNRKYNGGCSVDDLRDHAYGEKYLCRNQRGQ